MAEREDECVIHELSAASGTTTEAHQIDSSTTFAGKTLGPSVHRNADVLRALEHVRDHDPHPVVRKIARWYTPGGPIYKRLAPRPVRVPSGKAARGAA